METKLTVGQEIFYANLSLYYYGDRSLKKSKISKICKEHSDCFEIEGVPSMFQIYKNSIVEIWHEIHRCGLTAYLTESAYNDHVEKIDLESKVSLFCGSIDIRKLTVEQLRKIFEIINS